ncbi:MAG TPA: 5-(carboxyamino)imidazole ribonucleotide mutase [Ignavibacteria bacterium]|nr:5-(carboxyamino)imidazole ribonucleotide mutase [Ignavibacteria bacterium]
MKTKQITVGILMGSDSDLSIMQEARKVLEEFGISCEMKVASAHRSPYYVASYASTAHTKGMKVIIAGAGGAAHLPGVCAAYTPLPVIGVPITTKSLGGIDSLLSIVQMPSGVPVATVGIGGGKNAGILAAQIIAASDTRLLKKMIEYKKKLENESLLKNKKLTFAGVRAKKP